MFAPTTCPSCPQIPFGDNSRECMGTSLWSGIAMRSIWRRPSPFYPVQTSSALESCRFLARLPSSPQVVSEFSSSCHLPLTWVPSSNPGKKKKYPVLSMVGASMEAQFPLQFFALKESAEVLNLNMNSGHTGLTGRRIWRMKNSEQQWSDLLTIKWQR